jgi:predicted nucleic acid-binding protein
VAVAGWLVDNSTAARVDDPAVRRQLAEYAGSFYVCAIGTLEQFYSARSARDYDARRALLYDNFLHAPVPPDIFDRALRLQRDLAHHHGLWHRIPIPDLLIAETAIYHDLGILHVDGDFDRISEVRPLVVRRLG